MWILSTANPFTVNSEQQCFSHFFFQFRERLSLRLDALHTVACVQVQTLPMAQDTPVLTDSFSQGHDPYTHACRARPLSTDGWTSLSVIVIVMVNSGLPTQWIFPTLSTSPQCNRRGTALLAMLANWFFLTDTAWSTETCPRFVQ